MRNHRLSEWDEWDLLAGILDRLDSILEVLEERLGEFVDDDDPRD